MSINDFIGFLGRHPLPVVIIFGLIPVLTLIIGVFHTKPEGNNAPWKYFYSVLVYLSVIPGMFAAVLVGYALFFIRQNLLTVNALVYYLPLLSMGATLIIISRKADFSSLPGFGRLSGLLMMVAASFILALIIDRTHIFLSFFGSIDTFFPLVIGLFLLIKIGSWVAFKKKTRLEDM